MNITIKNNGGNKIEQDRINYGRSRKGEHLVGFGTFEVRSRSERQGRDPRTNSPITIPASKVPAFKVGKAFKSAIDK